MNLIDRQVEVYTEHDHASRGVRPADQPDYYQHRDYREDDTIPVVLNGQEVCHLAVRGLLPLLDRIRSNGRCPPAGSGPGMSGWQ